VFGTCSPLLANKSESYYNKTRMQMDGNGFGSRDGEIVQITAMALGGTIRGEAIGALTLAEEFAGVGVESQADGLELLGVHVTGEVEQLRAATVPLAYDALAFGVIVAVLQVPGRIALSVGHGADGQHGSFTEGWVDCARPERPA
jgi:hypothetical protein